MSNPAGMEQYLDLEERESRKARPGTLLELAPYIMRQPVPLALGFLMLLLGTGAALLEPRIFGYAVDLAIIPKNTSMLAHIGLIYVATIVVRVTGTIGQAYCFELLGQRVCQDLRCRLYSRLLRSPVGVHDRNPVGRLMTRVTNDIASLGEMFSAGFVSMVGNFLLVLGILTWLLILDLRLGLVSLLVFPVLVILSAYFSRRLKVAYREARSRLSALNAFLAENILGMKVVHLFNRQKMHQQRFDRINNWYADAQILSVRTFALFQPAITLASGIAIALVVGYGGLRAWRGTLPIGVLVAYFSYVLTLFQPIREIADKWNIFLSGMASAERVFSIMAWPLEPGASHGEIPEPKQIRGDLEFEHVWFAYSGEHWVLRDFSMKIPAGAHVGVVGHTGAGKTTLISLLMRFYEPQKGRILLDGRDIREYGLSELRSHFGVVQQDGFLFTGSIEDNITFWAAEKGDEGRRKLSHALDKSGLSLEQLGVEQTELGERASNISTGQRQVLAFARAIITDPSIWILDEATANVDSTTEGVLQRSLGQASRLKTAIFVAHRLSTIRSCDRIAVLHKGLLVEQGTHEDLLKVNGLYARLYRYQAVKEAQVSQKV